jgi:hypothetical protein
MRQEAASGRAQVGSRRTLESNGTAPAEPENAARVEELAASSGGLSAQVDSVKHPMRLFRLQAGAAGPGRVGVGRDPSVGA